LPIAVTWIKIRTTVAGPQNSRFKATAWIGWGLLSPMGA
jgi:hypothetical protein